MSVIIKGMEMPKNCEQCLVYVRYKTWSGDHGCFCGLTKKDILNPEKKNGWCPLIELPSHARLIDAKQLKEKVLKWMPPDPCGVEEKEYPFETDICVSMLMEIEETPIIFEEEEE